MLCSLLFAAMTFPMSTEFQTYGFETLKAVYSDFKIADTPGYAEEIGTGKPKHVAFNWGVGVMLSALNSAGRIDPVYKAELRRFADAAHSYWNAEDPVPGYDVLPMPKPKDRYYDDNAWMVLALTETSEVLSDTKYLGWAKDALKFVLSGEDAKLGGGIYWREQERSSKNTCSNGPSAAACLAVYERTKDSAFLKKARELYEWTRKNLQDPKDQLFWDAIRLDGSTEKTKWSYNTALMIRTAAELGRITGEKHYLQEAEEMAKASENRWIVDGRFADDGKFAHLLLESWRYVPSSHRDQVTREAMRWLWMSGRDVRGLFGEKFNQTRSRTAKNAALIDQASAIRAFFQTP